MDHEAIGIERVQPAGEIFLEERDGARLSLGRADLPGEPVRRIRWEEFLQERVPEESA